MKKLLIGTYSDAIYQVDLDGTVMGETKTFAKVKNSKYISVNGNRVATVGDFVNGSGVALLDENGEILDTIQYETTTSCYITWHDGKIYTANYHEGSFSVLTCENDKLKLENRVIIREGAGCHEVLFYRDQILVPCLFLDRIMIFDQDLNHIDNIRFSAGTGPRHGVFTEDGSILYVIGELSNELFMIDTASWSIISQGSVLPDDQTHLRDSAAIRLSADDSLVYVSTRTQDFISVLDAKSLERLQVTYCGGRHPRDFILVDDVLLCANRYSNTVVTFALDEDGLLTDITKLVNVPEGVSLDIIG